LPLTDVSGSNPLPLSQTRSLNASR
jgi:hypothetical protein